MKRVLLIMITALFLLPVALTGCRGPAGPPALEGLVFSIDGRQFLAVEGIEDAGVPYDEWFEDGNNAIFFTVTDKTRFVREGKKASFSDLEVGQKVRVWAEGGIMKSYPGQAGADRVEIISP